MSQQFRSDLSLLLISMPWATACRPSLSLSLLAALTSARGFSCDVLYPNVYLAALMSGNGYEYIANTTSLFGIAEHLFAVDVFGSGPLDSDRYMAEVVRQHRDLPLALEAALPTLREKIIPDTLRAYTQEVIRRQPRVVGFTCTFNQVMASVALAKRIRHADPTIHIVLGGPCVHAEMGVCYSRVFADWIDTVFLGEADELFPRYLEHLSSQTGVRDLPGIAIGGWSKPAERLFESLDFLPTPDYSHYFVFREQLEREGFALPSFHSLPFEASRGCWWGEKQHCTFCGLNNEGMRYRRKSVARIKEELTELARCHHVSRFMGTDNILDHRACRELLPELAAIPEPLELFFEIKTNISRDNVQALRKAGVTWVQPGIESFSDHVLALMRKGVSSLQNIQTLKWLYESGIETSYNLLVGFPGETEDDYADLLSLIGKLFHLPPPGQEAHIVQVQRFAPFHFASSELGIGPTRGARFYEHLIPPQLAAKEEYAYFFDRDIPPDAPLHHNLARVNARLREWCSSERRVHLNLDPRSLGLEASKDGVRASRPLDEISSILLVLCDQALAESAVIERVSGSGRATRERVASCLSLLESEGLLVRHRSRVLTLVPFSTPHSAAHLSAWLVQSGLPAMPSPPGLPSSMPGSSLSSGHIEI